jgi:hypothetical protein
MIPEVEARLTCIDVTYGEESSDMARTRHDDLWALAHAGRAALATDLTGLGAEQWMHDTLCGGMGRRAGRRPPHRCGEP